MNKEDLKRGDKVLCHKRANIWYTEGSDQYWQNLPVPMRAEFVGYHCRSLISLGYVLDDEGFVWLVPYSEMEMAKQSSLFITDSHKRVVDTIEIGELKTAIKLGCGGPPLPRTSSDLYDDSKGTGRTAHEYNVYVNYTFSYADKDGEISGFAISRAEKESEKFECDGVGDNIASVLLDLFKADYAHANDEQINDLVGEVLEMVQDDAKAKNWRYFATDYDKQTFYESES